MSKTVSFILLTFLVMVVCYSQQCCLQFNNKKCIACPEDMHIYKFNCIFNIANCSQHDGFLCTKCLPNFQLDLEKKKCSEIKVTPEIKADGIPSAVAAAAIGMPQLTGNQLNEASFLAVDQFIKNSYSSDLTDPILIAAYAQPRGFMTTYQIFYYANPEKKTIYEIGIVYNNVRMRPIPTSFNQIGY